MFVLFLLKSLKLKGTQLLEQQMKANRSEHSQNTLHSFLIFGNVPESFLALFFTES